MATESVNKPWVNEAKFGVKKIKNQDVLQATGTSTEWLGLDEVAKDLTAWLD